MNNILPKLHFRSLHYEISWGCNIACPMCTFHDDHHHKEFTNLEQVFSLSEGMELFKHVHMGDGSEPFINPNWYEIILFFKSKGKEVSLQTNAKYIRSLEIAKKIVKSGLDRISISIDGINDETISRIRKGITYKEIISAIDYINQAKKELKSDTPRLESNVVAMKSNIAQLEGLIDVLIDKNFKKVRIGFLELREINKSLISELLIYEKKRTLAVIEKIQDKIQSKNNSLDLDIEVFNLMGTHIKDNCSAYFERLYLRQDGNLYACYGKKLLGNAYNSGLLECLSSRDYKNFIGVVETPENNICSACRFCRVMGFDEINSHFGHAVVNNIGMDIIQQSIEYVENGGDVKQYWNRYFENEGKNN